MERTFLLLAAFIFSSGQCQDTDPSRDPDASLAVCKPDITSAAVPRVAFTATMSHSLGPAMGQTTVKYGVILSNMGNGYNPATGFFTAPVAGMYYFRYTMFNNLGPTPNSMMSLMRNGMAMVTSLDGEGDDNNDSASNAAVLQLEAGDNVYIELYGSRELFDNAMRFNTFSGFLLFPL
ncbi:complement C1q-like protein 4 isoform X2 [Gadus morhua]|uniref:complement C1q-like protein 4 isoform X2 n=1 Tax=Gadus morhua TaxID=8049 RepID=UPI0011B6561A|nr:complement C1q-like protein 4 isoform X2 [Gadus morhua]